MTDSSYYRYLGTTEEGHERFASTQATVSIWGPTLQHGAPPSALLVRALERCGARDETRLTRVVVEILGPIPIADLEVRSWIERPGRRIELIVAELWATTADGTARAVARGTAWRMETVDTGDVVHVVDPPLEPRDSGTPGVLEGLWSVGYLKTLDWSWIAPIGCVGTGKVWARPKPELVEGEKMSALERLFAVADISNGVGAKLDPEHWTFLNTESHGAYLPCARGRVGRCRRRNHNGSGRRRHVCGRALRRAGCRGPYRPDFADSRPFLISRNGRECA